ncbi:uncharacterized protein LOC129896071 [Solanum dulcamara]|uniref:uncharacterized protein LOC129896071 n=1 Tax=Solanum dulcamara TaxID=45834 RepID=UPI002485A2DC|nr:uncharacterized protein LOC129896071 [Solanum dulcamara]
MAFFFMNKIVKKKMMFVFFFFSFFVLETLGIVRGVSIVESISLRDDMIKMAGYGEEKLSTVFIHGKIVCHDHDDHGCNNIIKDDNFEVDSRPIQGASVGVFCGSRGKTRRSWARNTTNEDGDFLIDLPSHLHAIQDLEKTCLVKVFHLPRNTICEHAFRGKHKGLELISIGGGIRTYTTHKIHLTPKVTRRCRKKVVVM